MKVLFLGEIVGRCGIGTVKNGLKSLREETGADFVIANGEGATSGFGLGFQNALSIFRMGVDVLTMGEKSFFKLDMVESIDKKDRILRPANYPESAPGRGLRYFNVNDKKVCVINMLGMHSFTNPHLNNPFLVSKAICEKAKTETPYVFYIYHAQATAEKLSMGFMLDGLASAVIGTHTKAITADNQILKNGTAFISDTGRCGAFMSVGGFEPEHEIKKYRTQIAVRSHESWEDPQLQGLLVTFDENGKATETELIMKKVKVECIQQ